MKTVNFKGKTLDYSCGWLDYETFCIDIGDGELTDEAGNAYFWHIEYSRKDDVGKYIFEIWYEEEHIAPSVNLSEEEKTFLTKFLLHTLVESEGGKLEKIDLIDAAHRNSLWYGGEAARISYKGYVFEISAVGDVIGTLADEQGEIIEDFKDKGNAGAFYNNVSAHIKNDAELQERQDDGSLQISYGNWWECFVHDPNGDNDIESFGLDGDLIDEAVADAIGAAYGIVAWDKKEEGQGERTWRVTEW